MFQSGTKQIPLKLFFYTKKTVMTFTTYSVYLHAYSSSRHILGAHNMQLLYIFSSAGAVLLFGSVRRSAEQTKSLARTSTTTYELRVYVTIYMYLSVL